MASIFISHASGDQAIATEVCALLEARGVSCWIAPRDVAAGTKWDETIVDAITDASAFLLILTRAANESPYVSNEVNHAFAANKPIFTFRAEDVAPGKSLGFYLARHHWTDGFAGKIEDQVAQLATSVTTMLGAGEGSVATRPTTKSTSRVITRAGRRERLAWTTAAIAIGTAALLAVPAWRTLRPSSVPQASVARLTIALADGDEITGSANSQPLALSPDGRTLVYEGRDQLRIRALDSFDVKPLAGTAGGRTPFFSPDGQWVGFFANGRLMKVSIQGGTPILLCDVPGGPNAASWGPGFIVYSTPASLNLMRVADTGGKAEVVTTPKDAAEMSYRDPEVLPGGKAIVFTISGSSQIVVQPLGTGERRVLIEGGKQPRYAGGHLVYMSGGALMAAPFDTASLALSGAPERVLDSLRYARAGEGMFSVSAGGALVYVPGGIEAAPRQQPVWVDRRGAVTPVPASPRDYGQFSLSPDATRIATSAESGIWTYDLERNNGTRLTFGGDNRFPIWSPDGTRVAYASNRASRGVEDVFEVAADGSGGEKQLTHCDAKGGGCLADTWTPDGRQIIFHRITPSSSSDLWVMPANDFSKARPWLEAAGSSTQARISPDGRWVAYLSNESGRREVYVRSFADAAGRWQISTEGGLEPLWSRDGRELFFREGDRMMAVDVLDGATFKPGTPRMLFEGAFAGPDYPLGSYGISPDGRRFLMLRALNERPKPVAAINVVQNWTLALRAPQ